MTEPLNLVVVHYHLRPGGVRRVIERALPYLVRERGLASVTLLVGEDSDPDWVSRLGKDLPGVRLEVVCEPAFSYLSEQAADRRIFSGPSGTLGQLDRKRLIDAVRRRIWQGLERAVPERSVLWVHNPGLARNILLVEEIKSFAEERKARVVFHQHDFWFENRWERWAEMRRFGVRRLDQVANSVFAVGPMIRHAAINRRDAGVLARHPVVTSAFLPNLCLRGEVTTETERDAARDWLVGCLGEVAPVWLVPARILRRKNLAEAILLSRWLRPDAWLVVTGGVSSSGEQAMAERLMQAAREGGWRVRFAVLAEGCGPSIRALLAASEVALMTSVQEGFGLPYVEAVAAGTPLLARSLPHVVPDLQKWGFRLPGLYDEVWIDRGLLDWEKEVQRQEAGWNAWRAGLPESAQRFVGPPPARVVEEKPVVALSRLTLTGQLEVLAHAPETSWAACRGFNPDLVRWEEWIAEGKFPRVTWPEEADRVVGGPAYAERFWQMVERSVESPSGEAGCPSIQDEFFREMLGTRALYPILFPEP